MKLLLDTCAFLWLNLDLRRVPARIQRVCADPDNEVYLSAVSVWEISVKHYAGRLQLPEPPHLFIPKQRRLNGATPLRLRESAVYQLSKLPELHKDPFDRMLVCQAIAHSLALVTPDEWISRYPVRVLW